MQRVRVSPGYLPAGQPKLQFTRYARNAQIENRE